MSEQLNEEVFSYDKNINIYNSEWQRSNQIEKKAMSLFVPIVLVLIGLGAFLPTLAGFSLYVGYVMFCSYGVALMLAIYTLKPITLHYAYYDYGKDMQTNNDELCKAIKLNCACINKQCTRYNRAIITFLIATFISMFCVFL
jgi:fatty acid desaturase